jgi:hypothetical protein
MAVRNQSTTLKIKIFWGGGRDRGRLVVEQCVYYEVRTKSLYVSYLDEIML